MKRLIALIIALSMMSVFALTGCELLSGLIGTTTTTTAPEEEPPKVYSNEVQVVLLLGQSNAEGHTHSQYLSKTVGEEKAQLYAEGFEEVEICYANTISQNTSNGEFVPVKLGQGSFQDRFGPEIGMAEKIAELDPEKRVVIIKYAYGGTTLNNEWRSPSSGNAGRLYTGAVDYILQQLEALETMDLYPIVKAICWMQGESDASGLSFNNYESLEANFVKDLREDLAYYKPADSEIGFIDAGISDLTAWTQYKVINQAKMNLASKDEYHDYIDTIAAGLKYNAEPVGAPDVYHYDSKYMVQLGYLFAEVLLGKYLEL
ncbi:MAG: sialate O-acetylesterase [Eubacteriales bacterium]